MMTFVPGGVSGVVLKLNCLKTATRADSDGFILAERKSLRAIVACGSR